MKRFEVSAEWMQACGKGNAAKVFDVIKCDDYTLKTASNFFGHMLTVDAGGRPWVVAIGRGRFVD